MRVALIGTGRIGAAHAEVVRDHPEVEQLVRRGRRPRPGRDAGRRAGRRARSRSTTAMAAVDAVVIAAATTAHPELIVAAARRGLPGVLREAGRGRRRRAAVAGRRRGARDGRARPRSASSAASTPGYVAARDALRGGALGELRRVHALTADREPPAGRLHRRPRAASSATATSTTSTSCAGSPAARWSRSTRVGANRGAAFFAEGGDVDESAALLTLDDGTLVTLQGSRYNGGGHDVRMELAGTAATWVVGLDANAALVSAEAGVGLPRRRRRGRQLLGTVDPGLPRRDERVRRRRARSAREPVHGRRGAGGLLRRRGRHPVARLEHRPVTLAEVRSRVTAGFDVVHRRTDLRRHLPAAGRRRARGRRDLRQVPRRLGHQRRRRRRPLRPQQRASSRAPATTPSAGTSTRRSRASVSTTAGWRPCPAC